MNNPDEQPSLLQTNLFPIEGLSCASCAVSAEKVLKNQQGVKNAKVNFASGTAYVEYESVTQPEQLKQALQNIGYDLKIESSDNGSDIFSHLITENKESEYKKPSIISLVFFVPLFVVGMFFMHADWSPPVMLLLTLPIFFYGGRKFFIGAYNMLKQRTANMDTLVAVSTGIAFIFSLFNTFFSNYWTAKGFQADLYYEAAGGIITFVLLGKWLEDRAKSKTKDSIRKLIQLAPSTVTLLFDDHTTAEIPLAQVQVGNRLLIKAGERIPVDGKIVEGHVWIDQSSLTGEPIPIEKKTGDKVFSGTINGNTVFTLQAEKVGKDTLLSGIVHSVYEALSSKAPVQRWADQVSAVFTPLMLIIALITFFIWGILDVETGWIRGLLNASTVMIIACPCALGLATPTALMVSMGRAAENGILIKDAESLEKTAEITDIFFDKTGTLTTGKPKVVACEWLNQKSTGELNIKSWGNILYSIEKQSEHPLAYAVINYLAEQNATEIILHKTENVVGKGIIAEFLGERYYVGNAGLMHDAGVTFNVYETDHTPIYFAKGNQLIAIISVADEIRPEAPEIIQNLIKRGITPHLLTGDTLPSAEKVAKALEITNINAALLPHDKLRIIEQSQANNKIIAMIGDGINDSSALAKADVSIAMGNGSDVAVSVASMTLIHNDLKKLSFALNLSATTVRIIKQNLFWAFIYNLISIPIAAGVLYPWTHFTLNPMWAGLAMALSSISVVLNSLRLKKINI